MLARWIAAEFDRLGQPDDFRVVEVGAGPGTLARSILQVAPQWTGRYVAVELSAAQRANHPDGVESIAMLDDRDLRGVVIANELLDNMPFRLAVFDGGWREAVIEVADDGSFSERLIAAPDDWTWLPQRALHGARLPIQQRARDWVTAIQAQVAGTLLVFDYCTPLTAELAAMPWREWLRTYSGHERGEHYLRNFGLHDSTTQVCLDQLPEPSAVRSQAQILARWGIDDLDAEGKAQWTAAAAAPSVASLRMRSRASEAESLRDPTGLGAFLAVEWTTEAATVVSR